MFRVKDGRYALKGLAEAEIRSGGVMRNPFVLLNSPEVSARASLSFSLFPPKRSREIQEEGNKHKHAHAMPFFKVKAEKGNFGPFSDDQTFLARRNPDFRKTADAIRIVVWIPRKNMPSTKRFSFSQLGQN